MNMGYAVVNKRTGKIHQDAAGMFCIFPTFEQAAAYDRIEWENSHLTIVPRVIESEGDI